jgi:hypothetical protein
MEDVFCVPIALDAFCLTPYYCDGDDTLQPTRIAPITQPNYTGLRMDSQLLQHDVLDPVDLHSSRPASLNPRITDQGLLGHPIRQNRVGVYIHWSLPLTYRGGAAKAKGAAGYKSEAESAHPIFREVPNRWLIVRRLSVAQPQANAQNYVFKEYEGWVVEADRVWRIDDIDAPANGPNAPSKTVPDLEIDVSSFVGLGSSGSIDDVDVISRQAEVFLGKKSSSDGWTEPTTPKDHIPINVMSSSNPFFTDYTPHNANVFSICDTFLYGDPEKNEYLDSATASYCVMGWHRSEKADPVWPGSDEHLEDLLKSLKLQLSTKDKDAMGDQLNKPFPQSAARMLCHGTLKEVSWSRSSRLKSITTWGDHIGKAFRGNLNMEPVSVGASPLDSLLAFINAHSENMEPEIATLAKDIKLIAGLLLAADDSYDSQIKAQDLLYGNNFGNSDGGIEWHYKNKTDSTGKPAKPPSDTDLQKLAQYNHWQTHYDITTNALAAARWDLWSEWWRLVADFKNDAIADGLKDPKDPVHAKLADIKTKVLKKHRIIVGLLGQQTTLRDTLDRTYQDDKGKDGNFQPTSKDPFFQRNDPTVSLVGIPNPWDDIYLQTSSQALDGTKNALVRFGSELTTQPPGDNQLARQAKCLQSQTDAKSELEETTGKILGEFVKETPGPNSPPSDQAAKPWLKSWNNRQPFFPLFVEIGLIYYHIPKSKWRLETVTAGHPPHTIVRYVVDEDLTSGKFMSDARAISGRVPILPQQALSLSSMISQLLQSNLEDVQSALGEGNIGTIMVKDEKGSFTINKDEVDKLKYLSLPLAGITDQLTTRIAGTHVKPNARIQGQPLRAVNQAWMATQIDKSDDTPIFSIPNPSGKPIKGGKTPVSEIVTLMDAETALTPYGNLEDFSAPHTPPPFKAVTHGQAMITKLNIVDKFGQVIPALASQPRRKDKTQIPPALYPCISDYLMPGHLSDDKSPNVVYKDPSQPGDAYLNRFIQLTPAINQDARLNCDFVLDSNNGYWRKVQDWEQPIWGWVSPICR